MEDLFAVCAPGLEALTARELQDLGLLGPRTLLRGCGGVAFQGSRRDLYRANLRLRTADRVLVRLGEFTAKAFPELCRKAGRLPWKRYLPPGRPVALRVSSERSRLYHEGAVAQRIAESLGVTVARDAQQLIDVRLEDDLCAISLDSSGAPLHKRGYRLALAKAPLRETLAAAMVLASDWEGRSPLLDPFCGSGTIAIEAAWLARKIPPGRSRRFAFMDWPDFDAACWKDVSAEAEKEIVSAGPRIIASDRDAGAVQAAQANAQRAGVAEGIEFSCRAVSAVEPPTGPGWVVTNPPYGVRLRDSGDLRDLYAQLGKVLRAKCQGWHACVLCSDARLVGSTGLPFDKGIAMMNGGLKVRLASCLV